MGDEESSGAGVVKLTAVVTLDGLNGGVELGRYIDKEVSNRRRSVRFHA